MTYGRMSSDKREFAGVPSDLLVGETECSVDQELLTTRRQARKDAKAVDGIEPLHARVSVIAASSADR
ncbi:hypothetical protein COCMIDRAFT_41132 [Bipolaris oryzae ATCC 44560]|uniref:Uncharacterized protein n=1 Tax=Bipolaris oryzae ATCC 44560 TaxID=930090 RepID=W6YYC6_COCMI|nr:uncharacterized protein COCMIDRAFT_41132 [Bipolaris oryzae ATCC 44560]EUC40564.1 hypothetical protein COCMIDRAFT_41132 [Bipolaris oryzae ATCC 44560]